VGSSRAIVNIDESSNNKVSFENIYILGHSTNKDGYGFYISSDNIEVSKCRTRYCNIAITIQESSSCLLSGNHIRNGGGNQIDLYGSDGCRIIKNDIDTAIGAGIRLDTSDENLVANNIVKNCTSGINVGNASCDENTVIGNHCRNNTGNFVDNGTDTFGDATLNNFA